MPKVKKDYKYTKTYNEEELAKAIEAINNGMPKKQAAEKFKIPRQTLQYRLSEKFKKPTHGPATYLTQQEENLLEQWILEIA
ncbi:CENP-B N-terminal DNA-binding domain [Popillia japonica]|uniref:CENP-B N-terminal DNA-binding domain n=1 Tax=Popillia japonica TaxID=7064 RepID=A0AAW1KNZ7_POPJA